jgi:phage recombination protein Bet
MSKLTIYEKVSDITGYKPNEIAIIQQNVAKGNSATELAYFLNVCKTMTLNPFNKEVWCYKDGRGNLLIFAGRDGFLSKAQQNPLFNGIRSCEVRDNDEWSIDVANNKITHVISKSLKDRGEIIGAYCIVFRKGGEPTIEFADFKTYNKGYNAWKTHPAEMIKKVAESHALKKAFGISGIQSEYDFNFNDNKATPINTEEVGLTDEDIIQEVKSFKTRDEVMSFAIDNAENYIGTKKDIAEVVKPILEKM